MCLEFNVFMQQQTFFYLVWQNPPSKHTSADKQSATLLFNINKIQYSCQSGVSAAGKSLWLASRSYLAGVVMYDEARVPAVEMFVRSHCGLQFLQQSAIRTLPFGMHGGTHIIQHAHYSRRVLQGEDGVDDFDCVWLPLATDLKVTGKKKDPQCKSTV